MSKPYVSVVRDIRLAYRDIRSTQTKLRRFVYEQAVCLCRERHTACLQRHTACSYTNLRSFGARKRVIFLYGIKSSLSIVTPTDTHAGSKRLST